MRKANKIATYFEDDWSTCSLARNAVREKASQAHDVDVFAVLRRGDGDEVVTAKVYTNAPTSWFIENVPRLLKDKPASAEIDRAILHCNR